MFSLQKLWVIFTFSNGVGKILSSVGVWLAFHPSKGLKPYIDFNTKKEKKTNRFEKDFFKLMNKTVYGRTIESLRNRVDVRITDVTDHQKLVSRPSLAS